jgi:hypothetical protein
MIGERGEPFEIPVGVGNSSERKPGTLIRVVLPVRKD